MYYYNYKLSPIREVNKSKWQRHSWVNTKMKRQLVNILLQSRGFPYFCITHITICTTRKNFGILQFYTVYVHIVYFISTCALLKTFPRRFDISSAQLASDYTSSSFRISFSLFLAKGSLQMVDKVQNTPFTQLSDLRDDYSKMGISKYQTKY